MRTNSTNFNLFLRTLQEMPLIKRKLSSLKDRNSYYDEYCQYCQRHYLYDIALNILPGDLSKEINNYCKTWNVSVATVKKALRRVKSDKVKVNFVAGWYYKEELKNE